MKIITINYNNGSVSTILCNEFTISGDEVPILSYNKIENNVEVGIKVLQKIDVESIIITL